MNIVQIADDFISPSSGVSYTVPALSRAMLARGANVTVCSVEPRAEWDTKIEVEYFKADRIPFISKFRSSAALYRHLKAAARNTQIFHSNLMWLAPNIYPEFARRGTSCRHVVSPRGTMSRWALSRSSWKKKLSLMLGQNTALRHADMLHATAPMEYEELRAFGLKQPVAIIPNGLDAPSQEFLNALRRKEKSRNTLLFLGRIHPKKGIEELLEVWARIYSFFPQWELRIVGPLDDYALSEKRKAEKSGIPRVFFAGEALGTDKWKEYANADIFILPTFSENWGMTVAEAMASALPVITTHGAPWEILHKENAGAWIPTGVDALEKTLRTFLEYSPAHLGEMGARGQQWARRELSWHEIAQKMLAAYSYIAGWTEKPEFVITE